jgi:murein biosynthesis integral membrane protein MurJ
MKDTAKTISLVMVIMLAGKATGLLRDMTLNAFMGTEGFERTAFDPAMTIPAQFFDFALAAALTSAFVPVFNGCMTQKGRAEAFKLADKFITAAVLLSVIITVIGVLLAPGLINLFAGGITSPEIRETAARLLQMTLPLIIFTAFAFSLTGVLQSLGEFRVPAAMSILTNFIIIGFFFIFYERTGVWGLAAAFLIGWGVQAVIQIPSLAKRGYIYKPSFKFKDEGLYEIAKLTLPVIAATWVLPVNNLVNKRFASTLFDGAGMNPLTTATSLYSVITGVVILSITNVIFPKLARLNSAGDRENFSKTLNTTLTAALLVLIPMAAGVFLLAAPMIRIVFERGVFTAVSTQRTADALRFFALGMVGFGVQAILSRAFYAVKDAKTPMISSFAAIAVNFALSWLLVGRFGLRGVALSNSAAMTVSALIMLLRSRKLGVSFGGMIEALSIIKSGSWLRK